MKRTTRELFQEGIISTAPLWERYTGVFRGMVSKEQGWVRLFGRGIGWRSDMFGLSYSERNGYKRVLHIGPWLLWWLPKWKKGSSLRRAIIECVIRLLERRMDKSHYRLLPRE